MHARTQISYAAFYTGIFIWLGVQLPFFSGWLALKGLSAPEIGLVTGTALAARLALGPLLAYWADRRSGDGRALRLVSLIFALAAAALLAPLGKPFVAAAAIVSLWAFGVLVPLIDTALLRADRAGLAHFGKTRALGSFAFLTTNILAGAALTALGVQNAAKIMAIAAFAAFAVAVASPFASPAPAAREAASLKDARRLLVSPAFLLALSASGLIQGAHAFYYAFSILDWTGKGYSPSVIGLLWAVGVIAEILLLTRMRGLARRFRPDVLLVIGGTGAVLRWSVMAFSPPLPVIVLVQTLHALTFAAAYMGAIEFMDRAAPPRLVTTAMTLNATFGVGAVTGLATVAAGYLYQWGGVRAGYLLMAALAACGAAAALLLTRRWSGEPLFDARS
ncbi:MAG: hypothetical protein GC153_05390 [Alphaproteobacteria bacterium]|nr:hypothetical protein [Alphaproteobacteria bacterium]